MRPYLTAMLMLMLLGCSSTDFSGDAPRKAETAGPEQPAKEAPPPVVAPPADEPDTSDEEKPLISPPPPDVPADCQNVASTTGVADLASGQTFKLMTDEMSYADGVAACAKLGTEGKLIFKGQELPDEVLACQKVIGTLWMRASSTALWQPTDGGQVPADQKHWILCFHK